MSLLWVADSFYVGVHDIAAASAWYIEKLGLKRADVELDDGEGCVGLIFPKELPAAIVLGPSSATTDRTTRTLYTGAIEKARECLSSRGVNVGAIEKDRQGTQYFEMRDLEGNVIEVSEEP
jgi:hypothetical protein